MQKHCEIRWYRYECTHEDRALIHRICADNFGHAYKAFYVKKLGRVVHNDGLWKTFKHGAVYVRDASMVGQITIELLKKGI